MDEDRNGTTVRMTEDTAHITMRMPAPLYEHVCRVAIDRDMTASAVIRTAIKIFLQKSSRRTL